MHTQDFFCTTADGVQIATRFETPNPDQQLPVVLMIHGYATNKNTHSNTVIAPLLHRQGIATVCFDMRGSGQSEGVITDENTTTGLTDATAVLNWITSNPLTAGQKLGVIGSSYGGLVSTLLAEQRADVTAVVLKAPAIDWAAAKRQTIGDAGMEQWRTTGVYDLHYGDLIVSTPYSFYQDISSYDVYADAANITCPILIYHGDADQQIPHEQSQKLVPLIGDNAKLVVLPGADHGFSDPAAFEQYASGATAFFAAHLL